MIKKLWQRITNKPSDITTFAKQQKSVTTDKNISELTPRLHDVVREFNVEAIHLILNAPSGSLVSIVPSRLSHIDIITLYEQILCVMKAELLEQHGFQNNTTLH